MQPTSNLPIGRPDAGRIPSLNEAPAPPVQQAPRLMEQVRDRELMLAGCLIPPIP